MNRFSPLSQHEIEASSPIEAERVKLKPSYPPRNASPIDQAGIDLLGAGATVTKYTTAAGELVFGVARLELPSGEKKIRPLSWIDGKGWTSKAWPKGRPLLNLPGLTGSPEKPVLVVEGETCARVAAEAFCDFVVTTSSGGANAPHMTDWSAIKGRDVLIWPDCDEPGERYAATVARLLRTHGCTVSKVCLPSLMKLRPTIDGTGEPPPGWDVADAVKDWNDPAALVRDTKACRVPFEPAPTEMQFISWGDFKMDGGGLFEEKGDAKRDFIAGPFEVLGRTRDPQSSGWGRLLRWHDDDGREHSRVVPDADLHGEPAALCRELAAAGLQIAPAKQRSFRAYLSGLRTDKRATIVARTGWADIGGDWSFILPGGVSICPVGADPIILDGLVSGPYAKAGLLEHWGASVGALTIDHPVPILAISAALAGPLLQLANIGGAGITLTGQSSKGKSTVLQAAASVWGKGTESGGFVRSWRATANGLEGAAAGSTDTALVLDEVGTIRPDEMSAAIYVRIPTMPPPYSDLMPPPYSGMMPPPSEGVL